MIINHTKDWTFFSFLPREGKSLQKCKINAPKKSSFYHDFKLKCNVIIINYLLTARVAGAPQTISQPVSSIFPCTPLPSRTWQTPGLSIPWCYLPTSSSASSSSPLNCALQDGFGQTWWMGDMTIPLHFASLYTGQVLMWSDCLLNLGTDFLIGNMVFQWDT